MIHPLLRVVWKGIDGRSWYLAGPGSRSSPVQLDAPEGLVATPSYSTTPSSTGIGVRPDKRSFPEMTGTLKVTAFETDLNLLGEVHKQFSESFDTWRPGVLSVGFPGSMFSVNAVGRTEATAKSPWTPGLTRLSFSVSVQSFAGVWPGKQRKHETSPATVTNPGTLDLFPDVVWIGTGQQVTLPNGVVIDLPTVATEHCLSTDPGQGFRVTANGSEALDAWRQFRGKAANGHVAPGAQEVFEFTSGVRLESTPRVENPWR